MTITRRPWALLAVALATFMTYLDNNIVNVAIPAIQRDLHLSTSGLEWVVSGYILVFAGLLLAGGRFADAYGRRRLFLVGLAVFTAASFVAGLAGSVEVLIAARAVQGLGAALVTPTTLAIISHAYPDPRERTAAVGIWAGVGGLALAVGPLLGGLLSQHASWPWIFEINVPIGVATMALGAWAISESRDAGRKRLDVPGLVVSAVALTTLTWALIEGSGRGWTSPSILAAFVVAAAAGIAFVTIEQRAADPMVAVSLFRERVFSGGIAALMLWAFGLFGIYFFTSLYLQDVLGFSPTEAGLAFLPMAPVPGGRLGAVRAGGPGDRRAPIGDRRHGAHGDRHRRHGSGRRGRRVRRADADVHRDRRRRRADHAADRDRARRHAAGPGRRGLGPVQRLPGGRRAARDHRDRRDPHRPAVVGAAGRRPLRSTRSCPATGSGWSSRRPWSRSARRRRGWRCAAPARPRRCPPSRPSWPRPDVPPAGDSTGAAGRPTVSAGSTAGGRGACRRFHGAAESTVPAGRG